MQSRRQQPELHKTCTKCGEIKPATSQFFYKQAKTSDGFQWECKVCAKEYARKWYKKNREKHKLKCLQRYNEKRKDPEWVLTRRDTANMRYRQWYVDNADKAYAKYRRWAIENPGKINAIHAKRYARKLEATLEWLTDGDLKQIIEMYEDCAELTGMGYGAFHVDHIQPLQGKDRCGLHVPWNLQILTATANMQKGNRT